MRLPALRTRTAAVLVLVLLAALLAGGVAVRVLHERTRLQQALASVPAASQRVGYTDWAAVRERVAGSSASLGASRVQALSDKAYDADLSSASSIADSGPALAANFGFGPGNAQWETYAQSGAGAAMVLRLDDDVDLDDVADKLRSAGYDEPSSDDGVWDGGADLVSGIDASITPELQYVVLDRDRHEVVSSDTASYARTAARVAAGESTPGAKALPQTDAGARTEQLAGRTEDLASAVVWTGDFACEDLSMAQADPGDERQAEQRVSELGGVAPLAGLIIGERADGRVQVAMGFETDDQAVADLRPRAELAVGADPSRPQSVGETYRLTRSRTEGDAVLLDLRPRPDVGAGLTTLTSGPVLFATC